MIPSSAAIKNDLEIVRVSRSPLPGRSPEHNENAPFGGQSEVIQLPRKSGAGEGARTLDPDLGKVVLLLHALPRVIGAVYKKRAGVSADITMTTMMRDENRVKKCAEVPDFID